MTDASNGGKKVLGICVGGEVELDTTTASEVGHEVREILGENWECVFIPAIGSKLKCDMPRLVVNTGTPDFVYNVIIPNNQRNLTHNVSSVIPLMFSISTIIAKYKDELNAYYAKPKVVERAFEHMGVVRDYGFLENMAEENVVFFKSLLEYETFKQKMVARAEQYFMQATRCILEVNNILKDDDTGGIQFMTRLGMNTALEGRDSDHLFLTACYDTLVITVNKIPNDYLSGDGVLGEEILVMTLNLKDIINGCSTENEAIHVTAEAIIKLKNDLLSRLIDMGVITPKAIKGYKKILLKKYLGSQC